MVQLPGLVTGRTPRRVRKEQVADRIGRSGDYGSYRTEIDVVGSDGPDFRRITARTGTDQIGISWSPDGRSIAYVGLPDGSAIPSLPTAGLPAAIQPVDIFGINVDGTDDRNLTNSEADEYGPQWSPDGTHIAFQTSQDGGRTAVVRVDGATGVGSPILGPAGNSDMYPSFAWSPDGTMLLVVESDASDPSDTVQSTSSTVLSVDAEFRQAPVTLLAVDHNIRCAPVGNGSHPRSVKGHAAPTMVRIGRDHPVTRGMPVHADG